MKLSDREYQKRSLTRRQDDPCRVEGCSQPRAKSSPRCQYHTREQQQEGFLREPERRKNYDLRASYGITYEEAKGILDSQGGKCAICQKQLEFILGIGKVAQPSIDHDHGTGRIRGILCHNCNHGLGHFHDDPSILSQARAYLLSDPR